MWKVKLTYSLDKYLMITIDEDLKSVRLKIADSLLSGLTILGPLAVLASIHDAVHR